MRAQLEELQRGRRLPRHEARALFAEVVSGRAEPLQLAALLGALGVIPVDEDELLGAAEALRDAAEPFEVGALEAVDTCGTGGDGAGTFNVSTATALVVAAIGIPVVKHGNRSVSSRCGAADVLERLGVRVDAPAAVSRRCLERLGICFLLAPQYHPGMAHAMPVRRALGVRTVFNVLGPLINPARPRFQVLGVFDPALCAPVARVLGRLGVRRALVVHGAGLDEIALHGESVGVRLTDGRVEPLVLTPEAAGLKRAPLAALAGGDPDRNASILLDVLGGGGSAPQRDVVALNAGAVAWLHGRAATLAEGARLAAGVLARGAAAELLESWKEVSHGAR